MKIVLLLFLLAVFGPSFGQNLGEPVMFLDNTPQGQAYIGKQGLITLRTSEGKLYPDLRIVSHSLFVNGHEAVHGTGGPKLSEHSMKIIQALPNDTEITIIAIVTCPDCMNRRISGTFLIH